MDDDVIYSQGDVLVTKTLVKVGSVSYPVNGIGSVLVSKPKVGVIALIFGGVLGLLALGMFSNRDTGIGLVFLAVGAGLIYSAFNKPSILILRTSSGDQKALSDKNTKLLEEVKNAIETAVIKRG
jgi:Family of unknown function (DUF6232)